MDYPLRTEIVASLRVLGAVAALATFGCQPPSPTQEQAPTELRMGALRGFVIRAEDAPALASVAGDIALEGPELLVEVRARGRIEDLGALVAVRQPGGAHDWESLTPRLATDGALHVPRITRVRLATLRDRPGVVIEGVLELERTHLILRRTLQIADVRSVLHVRTHVRAVRGALPADLQVVERVAWGGGYPRVPGAGPLRSDVEVTGEWVARAVEPLVVLVAPEAGRTRIIGHNVDHGRADLLRYTDVWLTSRPSADGIVAQAYLSASRTGLGDAVRKLGWARGKHFAEVVASLSTHPPDALVEVIDSETGELVVSAPPDDRRSASLPLPESVAGKPLAIGARARGVEVSEWLPLEGPPYAPVSLTIAQSSVLAVRVQHGASGEPLPARIRVIPLRGTRAPDLGPDWKANGALDTVITAGGRAAIRLPAGYYRVIVTHGPEWSLLDQNVELGVGKTVELQAELERAIDPGAWIASEFHVHSTPSPDSQVTLEDRVASLVAEGIAFAVPTDHNHVTDFSPAIAAQPLWGLGSVPGVEVTTEEPSFGHFNAYPYPIDPNRPGQGAPEFRGLSPAELFASLHAVDPDLVVQVNHPRIEGGIGYLDVAEYDAAQDRGNASWSDDFDALEVWNGFDLARWPNVERTLGDWLAMLEHGHRIVATGSSDSHTIRSEGAGYPRTYVQARPAGAVQGKDVVAALRRGRAFVTSGPFLSVHIGEHGMGDTVVLDESPVQLVVHVQVPSWMQVSRLRVYLGTEVLRSVPIGPPRSTTPWAKRYRRTLSLPIEREGPLVVTVEGDATLDPFLARRGIKPFAFTNPIWLSYARPEPVAPAAVDAAQTAVDAGLPTTAPALPTTGANGRSSEPAHAHDAAHDHAH